MMQPLVGTARRSRFLCVSRMSNTYPSSGRSTVLQPTLRFRGGLALVSMTAFLVCTAPAAAQDVGRMDQIVQAAVAADEFTGSVLVARDGEVLFERGYGFA